MRTWSGLSLAGRLSLGFGSLLVLLLGLAALALVRMQALSSTLEDITGRNAARAQAVEVLENGVGSYVQLLGELSSVNLSEGVPVLKRLQTTLVTYDQAHAALGTLLPPDERAQTLFKTIERKAAEARELIRLGETLAEGRGETAQAFQIRNEYGKDIAQWGARQQAWAQAVNHLSDWQMQANRALSVSAIESASLTRRSIMGGTLLALLLGGGLAWWLVRDTRGALHEAVQATQRMARHDLSHPIETRRGDEIGGVLQALEGMRLNLHQLAQGVRNASDGIHSASSEIAQGSLELSNRTEEAASTLQRTLVAFEGMNASVRETSSASRSASALSDQASAVTTRGASLMTQVVHTMDEIDGAAHRIADITAIIDGIAFQTNILALNAAVEAARAGEQGRGFAVVASEVRALAGRSAEAAKEIKVLITASLDKVVRGTSQVALAGNTSSELSTSVQRVSGIIGAIAAETVQQGERIANANQAMSQLDQLVHQNAALAEESSAAAGSLRQQAGELMALVSQFELGAAASTGPVQTLAMRQIKG